ncbi:protein kinase domain-containing protein [Variovorax soli]|uniref:Serine/threonine protein phosphatase PrpC n=1 Tax=Variovorax soli TaxID=376815 RepID=A0ABU1NJL8_9BURK|nr:protein kinase [Variovorax soli]MDR6538649.1 serine/threonine protein phosphatase PrpC [Variovorax soli]
MPLTIAAGQYSGPGRKSSNQDFHGLCMPSDRRLAAKGIAIALADGISSSEFSRQASQAAVTSFLEDYYCTSEAWSVRQSAERVLAATNSWLFAQTQLGQGRYDKDRGWVCTFSAMVIKSRTAHLFHVGDARICQVQGRTLEPLTTDHRIHAGAGQSYLGRAFGIAQQVEIDYRKVPLEVGDTFVLATDGVHGHVTPAAVAAAIERHADDLDAAAAAIAAEALHGGSDDNLTVQVVRVLSLPDPESTEVSRLAAELPLPPLLEPRMVFDGYRVLRELHASSRSHVHLAADEATQQLVALKTPSIDLRDDPAYRERFLLEEWVARRVESAHLLKAHAPLRPRNALYIAMEYVEGNTLAQWMVDHPLPAIDGVRDIVGQLARGLRTMHRAEMVHQDLRPENVLIDATGTVKIIDFGATRVAGILEMGIEARNPLPGMAQYMAPEYFLGADGSVRGDVFSLGVLTYQMLTGRLPYGLEMIRCRSLGEQKRLRYRAVQETRRDIPSWIDDAIRKAVHPDPNLRYGDVSEFAFSLHRPDAALQRRKYPPLIERDPLAFWKTLSLLLALGCVLLLALLRR